METDQEKQQDAEESERVSMAAKNLAEYFDAVVILCTRHDGDRGTRTVSKGSGNWHTQSGLVREWMVNQEEDVRVEARRERE